MDECGCLDALLDLEALNIFSPRGFGKHEWNIAQVDLCHIPSYSLLPSLGDQTFSTPPPSPRWYEKLTNARGKSLLRNRWKSLWEIRNFGPLKAKNPFEKWEIAKFWSDSPLGPMHFRIQAVFGEFCDICQYYKPHFLDGKNPKFFSFWTLKSPRRLGEVNYTKNIISHIEFNL